MVENKVRSKSHDDPGRGGGGGGGGDPPGSIPNSWEPRDPVMSHNKFNNVRRLVICWNVRSIKIAIRGIQNVVFGLRMITVSLI